MTSVPFHLVCVLFRVSCLAYFFATFRYWTILVIAAGIGANIGILEWIGASNTVSFLLGAVSLFMPNGYLLYNFAATFPVDFTFEGTRKFLLWHMAALTVSFLACVTGVVSAGLRDATWLAENVPEGSVLNDYDVQGRKKAVQSWESLIYIGDMSKDGAERLRCAFVQSRKACYK